MGIRIYTAEHCVPCRELKAALEKGLPDGVEVVDIETDEGFEKFSQEVLAYGDAAVPSAYKDGKRCQISLSDDGELVLDCATDDQPSTETD